MKKYVKCVGNHNGYFYITIGKVYELLENKSHIQGTYCVMGDSGWGPGYFDTEYFEVIACPCNVKNCLKHRVKSKMIVKYVKAINDDCLDWGIKRGDVCTVLAKSRAGGRDTYVFDKIYDGGIRGTDNQFYAISFVPVTCPCDVKNCFKHRKEQ